MIETMDCATARISLGVYVLGAIDPAERALVEAHLATCRDCRDELAGLAGLPALLAHASGAEAIALADDTPYSETSYGETPYRETPATNAEPPPADLLGTVLDLAAARRRRRKWRTVGLSAAAAVLIAAAAFGGGQLASGGGPAQPAQADQGLYYGTPAGAWTTAHGVTAGMYATVMYRQMGWGTQLAAKVVGIPVGTPCQLIVVGHDGKKTVAGAWTTDTAEGTVYYPASTSVSAQDVSEFQITVAGHQVITVPV
jgi:hypothetical protein